MSANGISTLSTKQAKQVAKLNLAANNRQADAGNRDTVTNADNRYTLTINNLPTKYSGNAIVDNANSGGLVIGRPWS